MTDTEISTALEKLRSHFKAFENAFPDAGITVVLTWKGGFGGYKVVSISGEGAPTPQSLARVLLERADRELPGFNTRDH